MTDRYAGYRRLGFDRPEPRVLRITMENPGKLNAADEAMHAELVRVWRDIDADPDVGAAIIRGAGEAFSAGGDLDLVQVIAAIGVQHGDADLVRLGLKAALSAETRRHDAGPALATLLMIGKKRADLGPGQLADVAPASIGVAGADGDGEEPIHRARTSSETFDLEAGKGIPCKAGIIRQHGRKARPPVIDLDGDVAGIALAWNIGADDGVEGATQVVDRSPRPPGLTGRPVAARKPAWQALKAVARVLEARTATHVLADGHGLEHQCRASCASIQRHHEVHCSPPARPRARLASLSPAAAGLLSMGDGSRSFLTAFAALRPVRRQSRRADATPRRKVRHAGRVALPAEGRSAGGGCRVDGRALLTRAGWSGPSLRALSAPVLAAVSPEALRASFIARRTGLAGHAAMPVGAGGTAGQEDGRKNRAARRTHWRPARRADNEPTPTARSAG